MFEQCRALFLFSILSFLIFSNVSLAIKTNQKSDEFELLYRVLTVVLDKCAIGLENVIIYDNTKDRLALDTLTTSTSSNALMLKSTTKTMETQLQPKTETVQGVILIIDNYQEMLTLFDNVEYYWPCSQNCTLIIMLKNQRVCTKAHDLHRAIASLNVAKTHLICPINNTNVAIITHSPYGNRNRPRYDFYMGILKRDVSDTEICKKFSVDQINFMSKPQTMVGIFRTVEDKNLEQNLIVRKHLEKVIHPIFAENIKALEKILNTTFIYYVKNAIPQHYSQSFYEDLFSNTAVDVVMNEIIIHKHLALFDSSQPSNFEDFVIISHNRGLATPLEKIAKFYGLVTLISLLIILFVTFIVICLKMNRNISWAFFDVLRLLINSGVTVPLNTLSIKIFFSMIFLYFLIIHATFSGHLAEFLTIPAYRDNIDSLQHLLSSEVKTIYTTGFNYENNEIGRILEQKTVLVSATSVCYDLVLKNPDSVCLGSLFIFRKTIVDQGLEDKLYISKNSISTHMEVLSYRKRFPLREQFDWALTALTETRIYNRWQTIEEKRLDAVTEMKQARSKVDYRPVKLEDLKFAFILLIVGHGLASICFLVEVIIGRRIYVRFGQIRFCQMITRLGNLMKIKWRKIFVFKKHIFRRILRRLSAWKDSLLRLFYRN